MLPTAPALEKRQAHADRATWGKPRNCSSALRLPGGWGVSFPADVQNPPGRLPVGSDLGVPALPEGLDWVICQGPFWSLTFCDFLRMFLKSSLGACAWRKAQGLLIVLPTSSNRKWIRALPVEVVADLMTTHPCFLSQVAEHPELTLSLPGAKPNHALVLLHNPGGFASICFHISPPVSFTGS